MQDTGCHVIHSKAPSVRPRTQLATPKKPARTRAAPSTISAAAAALRSQAG